MDKVKENLYAHYFEGRIKHTIDLTNLDRVYKTKYFWMIDHLKDVLPSNKNSKILVLGCGVGHEVYALNKMGYRNVLGIDISEEQIEVAKANKLNCKRADAFKFLEKSQDKFDTILAFNFIEHFDLAKAFKLCVLCYDNLTEKGRLILLTPNASNPLASHLRYADPTHEVAFTCPSITQLLTATGFKKIEFKNVKPFGKMDDRMIMRILKFFGTIVVHMSWILIRLFYWINGIKPPKVVSPDLLVIAYRGD